MWGVYNRFIARDAEMPCSAGGKTNSTSGKESAASRASARGSDGDYKMSFRKIFTLLIRQ